MKRWNLNPQTFRQLPNDDQIDLLAYDLYLMSEIESQIDRLTEQKAYSGDVAFRFAQVRLGL